MSTRVVCRIRSWNDFDVANKLRGRGRGQVPPLRCVMDDAERLLALVGGCVRGKSTVTIEGHGSKARYGAPEGGIRLCTREHAGIVDYRPEELVVTAFSGTSLVDLTDLLAEQGQILPFDPPGYGGAGTLGGAIASGLSGPARPWRGSVRDAVLGVEIINGRGERLRFGGSVMKNVAGYDVSRLMTGAWGTLGVILSASVRLSPAPETEETFALSCGAAEAGELNRRWARQPLPITGTCHVDGELYVRLSGSAAGVESASDDMGLHETGDADIWAAVRDHGHAFFDTDGTLTRLSLPRGTRFDDEAALIEWGGCQAWLHGEPEEFPDDALATVLVPGEGARRRPVVDAATVKYTARIKAAFDPHGIFNPGVKG